jgi:hypothetical protein
MIVRSRIFFSKRIGYTVGGTQRNAKYRFIVWI